MTTEAPVDYRNTLLQRTVAEYPKLEIIIPQIPLAGELHAQYEKQRELEKRERRYSPGELLPVRFDQPSLRKFFSICGREIPTDAPVDWYNPTQPFDDNGDKIMAVRIEPRGSELSLVGFLRQDPQTGEYILDHARPIIDMAQDPSVTSDNNGNPVFGIVKIRADENGRITNYHTEQYRGPDVNNLELFQTIPGKDNRPVQLADRVRAFYRPQGELGESGKLAFRDYKNWDEYRDDTNSSPLTEKDLLTANFQDGNHGGQNFPLPDGQVYGHIAEKEYDEKGNITRLHYYITWMLTDSQTGQLLFQKDLQTGRIKPLFRIVADRDDFPQDPIFIPDKDFESPDRIHDVVFTGGVESLADGNVRITAGVSDTRIGIKIIRDPMLDVDRSNLLLSVR